VLNIFLREIEKPDEWEKKIDEGDQRMVLPIENSDEPRRKK